MYDINTEQLMEIVKKAKEQRDNGRDTKIVILFDCNIFGLFCLRAAYIVK